jgi:hypothetical protein
MKSGGEGEGERGLGFETTSANMWGWGGYQRSREGNSFVPDVPPSSCSNGEKFLGPNVDDLVKSQKMGFSVIPAKAGIQLF